MLKMAIITGFLSKTKDRFHEYNQPLDLDGKFKLMAEMDGFDGVEIVYPYEVNDAAADQGGVEKAQAEGRRRQRERQGRARVPKRRADLA